MSTKRIVSKVCPECGATIVLNMEVGSVHCMEVSCGLAGWLDQADDKSDLL
jgi:predicted RNA-binding Zn-ribbon protein involved in translation (DUF1610 family)